MIDAIKIRTSVWYAKENFNQKINNKSIQMTQGDNLDVQKMTEILKDYFYEQLPKEKKEVGQDQSIWCMSQISPYAVDCLAQEGYSIEDLEVERFERLQTPFNSIQRASNSQAAPKIRYSGIDHKVDRLKEHTDSMYVYAMNQDGYLSINTLYKGSFSGISKKQEPSHSKGQIGQVLLLNDIPNTQGNSWAASKLLELDLDVSKDSVVKIQNIKAAVDGLQKEEESKKAAEDIDQGLIPGERPLMEEEKILYTERDMQDIIDDLTKVDEGVIKDTLLDGKEITIGNLRETMHRNTKKVLDKTDGSNEIVRSQEELITEAKEDIDRILETKGQINEIRARLSASAAIKISEKMPLESAELSKVVKELIALEEIEIDIAIKEIKLEDTEVNKQLIKDTLRATYEMSNHKEWTVGLEMNQEAKLTIEDFSKVLTSYEGHFLQVEKRFGETVGKVEEQIEDFLLHEQIPTTIENIQAAKALISNQVDITQENMREATEVMTKINVFLEEMTPERAAIFIKEGINPYKASVNQLLDWIGTEKLPALKGSVAEAIVGLESNGQINESQKRSLIGLYRMIGAIANNKEEIAGYLYKNKLPLTMEKLEEASKYVGKSEHIKVSIDDTFGELEEIKYAKETAKQMMEIGKLENDKLIRLLELLEHTDITNNLQQGDKLSEIKARIYPFVKEQIKQELGEFEGVNNLSPSMMEKLEGIRQINPEVIEVMQKYSIPITISNLYWMDKLIEEPNLYSKVMEEQGLVKDLLPEDLETLEKELEELGLEANERKERAVERGDILGYRAYKKLEEVVGIQKQLIEKEGFYQIPFIVEGETKLIHLRVQDNTSKHLEETGGIKAIITYDTKTLGTVVARLNIRAEEINYEVQGEDAEVTNKLRQSNKGLENILQTLGYIITQNNYVVGKASHPLLTSISPVRRGDSAFEEVI